MAPSDHGFSARRIRVAKLSEESPGLPDATTSELVALLYDELKTVATILVRQQRPGQTITPTVLVNEAYLRLIGDPDPTWHGRSHFFGAAAHAMRHVLADYWTRKNAQKRGGGLEHVALHTVHCLALQDGAGFEDLSRALDVLEREVPRAFDVVLRRIFLGFNVKETAELMGVSARTVEREWTFAKAFLATQLEQA